MWGTRQTGQQRAIGTAAWLWLLCAVSACTGPGVEPPGDPHENGGPEQDAGDDLGSGGSAASGGAGAGGTAGVPTTDPGDGDGDSTDPDAGEASSDASVDDDGGTDPRQLEP
jgi:hypothetical protein